MNNEFKIIHSKNEEAQIDSFSLDTEYIVTPNDLWVLFWDEDSLPENPKNTIYYTRKIAYIAKVKAVYQNIEIKAQVAYIPNMVDRMLSPHVIEQESNFGNYYLEPCYFGDILLSGTNNIIFSPSEIKQIAAFAGSNLNDDEIIDWLTQEWAKYRNDEGLQIHKMNEIPATLKDSLRKGDKLLHFDFEKKVLPNIEEKK